MNVSINEAAQLLNVSLDTLRRWDNEGKLASERSSPSAHRTYSENSLEDFLSHHFKYLFDLGSRWAFDPKGFTLLPRLYCADRSVFKARLSTFEAYVKKDARIGKNYPLITSVVGEIGNNSFDHNLGNWPDISGIFFGYSLDEKKLLLADRGQGLFKTLQRVKQGLRDDAQAIEVAFTEILSGRSPESRGNGLKYVRAVVTENDVMRLLFQSGTAQLQLRFKARDLKIESTSKRLQGCLAVLEY